MHIIHLIRKSRIILINIYINKIIKFSNNLMIVDDFTLTEKIGKGSFGEVFLTRKKNSNQLFATKKVAKSVVLQDKIKRYFNNEIFILKNIDHQNIIKLYELKQTINSFYLIFEHCNGGSLSSCMQTYIKTTNKPFTEDIVQHIMKKVISAIFYLHKNKIIHRDLKLDNILVHFESEEDKKNMNLLNSEIKIIDFGFARYLQSEDLATSVLGSPINMDPQILGKLRSIDNKQNENFFGYDLKADIWSLGTVAYELLIGAPPFDADSYDDLLKKVNQGDYYIPSNIELSKQSISFLNGLLQHNPKQRLSVDELIYHEFLVKEVKTFNKINLAKLSKQYSDTKELQMSAKDNKQLWFLFETPGSNESLSDISTSMFSNKSFDPARVYRVNYQNMERDKGEDFIASVIGGMDNMQLNKQESSQEDNKFSILDQKEEINIETQIEKEMENNYGKEFLNCRPNNKNK
jgi:serine/threonine protein kinase